MSHDRNDTMSDELNDAREGADSLTAAGGGTGASGDRTTGDRTGGREPADVLSLTAPSVRGHLAVRTLRALRLGCLLALAVAYGLSVLWGSGLPIDREALVPRAPVIQIAAAAWFLGLFVAWRPADGKEFHDTPAAVRWITVFYSVLVVVVIACAAIGSVHVAQVWWEVYEYSSVDLAELLAVLIGIVGTGTFLVTDLLLRLVYRTRSRLVPAPPPGRWPLRHLRHPLHGATGWARPGLVALALAPSLVLGTAAAITHAWPETPNRLTTEQALPDPLPVPSALAPEAGWSLDVPDLLDVAAGAAGPIMLTPGGLTALDPRDGSTAWTLEREGASFASFRSSLTRISRYSPFIVTSPDRRYLAVRVEGPGDDVLVDEETTVVLTIDSLTGEVTGEHLLVDGGVQLTDSAVLCGETAYSLSTGAELWHLGGESTSGSRDDWKVSPTSYSGPAGHASFILSVGRANTDVVGTSVNLHVVPDTDPSAVTRVNGVMAHDDLDPLVIDGWVGLYTSSTGSAAEGWPAQAANLDALAGVPGVPDDRVDLGRTVGTNEAASVAVQDFVVLPTGVPDDPGFEMRYDECGWDTTSMVQAVLDLDTKTVTPPERTPGLAAATIGGTLLDLGEAVAPALRIQPGDGGAATTIPVSLDPATGEPEESVLSNRLPAGPHDLCGAVRDHAPYRALSAPGVAVIVLKTTPSLDATDWNDTYRLYGVPGAPS